MKRIASLLMLAARSTLWKAAGITLASCLTEAGLFLAALSGWQRLRGTCSAPTTSIMCLNTSGNMMK